MMIPFSLAAYYFNHFGQPRYPKIATISGPKIASALDRRRAKAIHRKLSQGCRSAIVLRSGLTTHGLIGTAAIRGDAAPCDIGQRVAASCKMFRPISSRFLAGGQLLHPPIQR